MTDRNPLFSNISEEYLFPLIQKKKRVFLERYPEAKLLSLSIGDTALPISSSVSRALTRKAEALSHTSTYSGYGPENGEERLREKISRLYPPHISSEEIFISDGAKCDIGRLQLLFGYNKHVSIQDPAYPVYVDTSRLMNHTISLMPCTKENAFFPDLIASDICFFCSPNNPTGVAASYEQLETLVHFAMKHGMIIIFDAAYSAFIQDPSIPKTIYEIPGAESVAIEVSSFSKTFGFTGVRLGWSVVPKALTYRTGESVYKDWKRLFSTFFNGASNLAQAGGIEALEGNQQTSVYMDNARLLKEALPYPIYGGEHAPYLWVDVGMDSWKAFDHFLEEHHLLITPGSGFGKEGEGFVRISAFALPQTIEEACRRLSRCLL